MTVEINVATPCLEYKAMETRWELPETLLGGTPAMQEAGEKYLPKEPKESDKAYEIRLRRTKLYNVYKRAIQSQCGQALTKPVTVMNVPEELSYLEYDMDGTGRSITDITYDLFFDALVYGKCHGVADFPAVDTEGMTYREFVSTYKPYFTHVTPRHLIGWETDPSFTYPVLDNIRILEQTIEPSFTDRWGQKVVRRVRVVYRNRVEVWRLDPELDKEYTLESESENTLGFVPLVTAYVSKTGFLQAEPPMEDLAYLNLSHWQDSSDYKNILHIAQVPFLFANGFEEGELENVEIGVNRMIVSTSSESNIKFVEHTGTAIAAGRQNLLDLKEEMGTVGADLVMRKSVDRQTATARKIDQSESLSILQITLRNIETMLENFYLIAGKYIGVDASAVSVSIGADLNTPDEPNPTMALLQLQDLGYNQNEIVEIGKTRSILPVHINPSDPIKPREENTVPVVEQPVEEQAEDDEDTNGE